MPENEMDPKDDRPTVTIRRDQLMGLLHRSERHVHTVPREQVRARGSTNDLSPAAVDELPEIPFESPFDDDDAARVPPLLVLGIIAMLVAVFVGIVRLA